jgi:hypothetical protein
MFILKFILWCIAGFSCGLFGILFYYYAQRQWMLWKVQITMKRMADKQKDQEIKDELHRIATGIGKVRKSDTLIDFDE